MLETARHVARSKETLATVISEAGRQRETWIPRWIRYPDARRQVETNSETRCSIVRHTHSNVGNECAEAVLWCRKQNMISANAAWMSWHSGVAGSACREGCLREDVRSHILMTAGMKRPNAGTAMHVKPSISETREMMSHGIWEVGKDHSSDERSVMDMDAKDPYFEQVPPETEIMPYSPEGVSHGR